MVSGGLTNVMTSVSIRDVPVTASTGARRRPAARVTPQGIWGPWLVQQRIARKRQDGTPWTQDDAFRFLRPWFGWSESSRASYVKLEHNKLGEVEDHPDVQQKLLDAYGAPPPQMSEAGPSERDGRDLASLVARLDEQARVIDRQAEAITRLAMAIEGLIQREPVDVVAGRTAVAGLAASAESTLQHQSPDPTRSVEAGPRTGRSDPEPTAPHPSGSTHP